MPACWRRRSWRFAAGRSASGSSASRRSWPRASRGRTCACRGRSRLRATTEAAVAALAAGALVVFPTETVYGLGADALSADAVARLLAVRGREEGKPILVLVADLAMAETVAASTSTAASSRAAPPPSRRSRRGACACCAPGACRMRRSAGRSRATEVAVVRPLQGLRYDPARAGDLGLVLAPPYDVITP